MTAPRAAATLVVVRDGARGIEVVLGLRPPGGPFGGVWVFPGGAVDPEDVAAASDAEEAWRLAALRETWEEVGLAITDPAHQEIPPGRGHLHERMAAAGVRFATGRLVYLSNWITPAIVSKRFDTRFFLVAADGELTSSDELAQADWHVASEALARHVRDRFPLMSPTVSHLRYLAQFRAVGELLEEAGSLDRIPAVEPRLLERGVVVDNDPRSES